eukprot:2719975-Pyramimonas_sp.AAC.1
MRMTRWPGRPWRRRKALRWWMGEGADEARRNAMWSGFTPWVPTLSIEGTSANNWRQALKFVSEYLVV